VYDFGVLRVTASILCGLLAAAEAAPPTQKPIPVDYPIAAMKLFAAAVVLERDGDLADARRAYERSNDKQPHASAYFNLGRIYLQSEEYGDAIRHFQKYLELAPTARDRAEVTALIESLRSTVHPVWIEGGVSGDEGEALVLLDGVVIGRSPMTYKIPIGTHIVERITSGGYGESRLHIAPGAPTNGRISMQSRAPGNVVIGGFAGMSMTIKEGEHELRLGGRFALPVGRHTTDLAGQLCVPITIVVKAVTEVTYVYVERGKPADTGQCEPVVRTQTQVLRPRP
jgi:tetratricopeptide (TPR) repeat protein